MSTRRTATLFGTSLCENARNYVLLGLLIVLPIAFITVAFAVTQDAQMPIELPNDGDLHGSLEAANDQYPDHSVAVLPSGGNHMGSGMMMHPLPLPTDATRPTVGTVTASQRGDYTLSCMTYCGYGHVYMDLDGALLVR